MKIPTFGVATAALVLCAAIPALAQQAHVIVTAEARHGKAIPEIQAQDLRVTEGRNSLQVDSLTPIGDAPMQLALLIDNSAGSGFGTELNTIKQFIQNLPPSTQIAVGYMRNGMADYTQQFTADHAAAANAVRLSEGFAGADVSPYDSLSDAVKKWPTAPDIQRREVVMITSGIEGLGGGLAPENPYVNKSIQDAQKAGVVVYGIYNPSVGHAGHSLWRLTYGQNLLSQMCDETGGESYIQTFSAPVDFGPYFRQILDSMQHQYLLTFNVQGAKKAGMQQIKIRPSEKDFDVAAPSAVYVGR